MSKFPRKLTGLLWAALPCLCTVLWGGEPTPTKTESVFRDQHFVVHGDMILPKSLWIKKTHYYSSLWPGGIIPYQFEPDVSETNRDRMRVAMDEWEAAANLRFVPRNGEAGYVNIENGNQNAASVGFNGGAAFMIIQAWGNHATLLHELGHTLGLFHEHQRPDRDQFVDIIFEHIQGPNAAFLIGRGNPFGDYDFRSIMHYSQFASAIPPDRTIIALPPNQHFQNIMGTVQQLSSRDKSGMLFLYPNPDDLDIRTISANVNAEVGTNANPIPTHARSHGNGSFPYELNFTDTWIAAISPQSAVAPPRHHFPNEHQIIFQTSHLDRGTYTGIVEGIHLDGGAGDSMTINLTISDPFEAIDHLWHQPDLCDPQSGFYNSVGRMVIYQNNSYACL